MDVTEDITCLEYETEVENERTEATMIDVDSSDMYDFRSEQSTNKKLKL